MVKHSKDIAVFPKEEQYFMPELASACPIFIISWLVATKL